MKITYTFATRETVEIEVDDAWGEILVALDRQEYNIDHTETRRHNHLIEFTFKDGFHKEDAGKTSALHYHRETGGIDMFPFSESAYRWLKWLATNVLPALAALAGTVGLAVGFGKTDIVVTIIAAVATFISTLVEVSTGAYNRPQSATTAEEPPTE